MSLSEFAFKDAADELRRLLPRVMPSDAGALNNAIDLLMSAHDCLVGDPLDDDEYDDEEPDEASGNTIGDPPVHLYLFCIGDINVFAISVEPLKPEELAELEIRCSFPLDRPLAASIEVASITYNKPPGKPVHDSHGRQIGTAAEILRIAGVSVRDLVKGGGV